MRGDDGVGWLVATRLIERRGEKAWEVGFLHQLVPELADDFGQFDVVVLVDASAEQPPGSIRICELQLPSGAESKTLTHHLNPARLLGLALELHGRVPREFLISIGGKDFGFSEELSPAVKQAAEKATRYIESLLHLLEQGWLDCR